MAPATGVLHRKQNPFSGRHLDHTVGVCQPRCNRLFTQNCAGTAMSRLDRDVGMQVVPCDHTHDVRLFAFQQFPVVGVAANIGPHIPPLLMELGQRFGSDVADPDHIGLWMLVVGRCMGSADLSIHGDPGSRFGTAGIDSGKPDDHGLVHLHGCIRNPVWRAPKLLKSGAGTLWTAARKAVALRGLSMAVQGFHDGVHVVHAPSPSTSTRVLEGGPQTRVLR